MSEEAMWLSLGAVLLIVELLGLTGGFLFGIAIAALATSLIVWLFAPASIWTGIGLFAALSVVLTWAYWRYFRRFNDSTDAPGLHRRADSQIGVTLRLTDDVGNVPVPHFIGDTRWRLVSEGQALDAGTQVVVRSRREDGALVIAAVE